MNVDFMYVFKCDTLYNGVVSHTVDGQTIKILHISSMRPCVYHNYHCGPQTK